MFPSLSSRTCRRDRPARVLEIGTSDPKDRCTYPDIDMIADHRGYTHRDGTPYPLLFKRMAEGKRPEDLLFMSFPMDLTLRYA